VAGSLPIIVSTADVYAAVPACICPPCLMLARHGGSHVGVDGSRHTGDVDGRRYLDVDVVIHDDILRPLGLLWGGLDYIAAYRIHELFFQVVFDVDDEVRRGWSFTRMGIEDLCRIGDFSDLFVVVFAPNLRFGVVDVDPIVP